MSRNKPATRYMFQGDNSVKTIRYMFQGDNSVKTIRYMFQGDNSVKTIRYMFQGDNSVKIFVSFLKKGLFWKERCCFTCQTVFGVQKSKQEITKEPPHDNTNKMACAPSEDSSAWASAQSDLSFRCALNGSLRTQGFFMWTAKTLIRLGGYPGWSDSSLGAQSFCRFCHVAAQMSLVNIDRKSANSTQSS